MNTNGWQESAAAWIARMGETGDNGRRYVLDPCLIARVQKLCPATALDVGCGEGRLCRLLTGIGVRTTGIDPTSALIDRALHLDPGGSYLLCSAEALPFPEASFDLVISCLSLVDIDDYRGAIAEMARVLKPGGHLLVANLTDVQSAGMSIGWQRNPQGIPMYFGIDEYSTEWSAWVEWAGIRVRNWHRPMSAYMKAFLSNDLVLRYFDEPQPIEGYVDQDRLNARVPWFNVLEWEKPETKACC